MITPRFNCSQTERSVVISIYCPSIRAADVEIHVDETLVSVHVNPYFLRLNFSYPLLEDDSSTAKYDPSSGYLTISLMKQNEGQAFHDLDLLSKLLAPRASRQPRAAIEVIGEEVSDADRAHSEEDSLVSRTNCLTLDAEHQEILKAAKNDWQVPQKVSEPQLGTSVQKFYGFLDLHSEYFAHVTHTENEVNELGADAESCLPLERRRRRLEHEDSKFDPEHYMADFADDENIKEILRWTHPHTIPADEFAYSEEEKSTMLCLPRREYLPTPRQTRDLYLTLLTLLLSYAYESRTSQHDPTPESAWTISTLIPAFSALDPPSLGSGTDLSTFSATQLHEALIPFYRRSLTFPLYRSFVLAEACRLDAAGILSQGKRMVTRCLLEMKDILDHHEVYYVYSKIWVDDFCVWTQAYSSEEALMGLGKQVKELKIAKASTGWDIEALEAATQRLEERDSDSDDQDSEFDEQ